jgi:simple sugar transport system permease protein
MLLIGALIVFLEKGAIEIASQFNLSDHVSNMLTGIILFFLLASEFFIEYKINFPALKEEAK